MTILGINPRLSFRKIDYLDASNVQSLDEDISTTIRESIQTAQEDDIYDEEGRRLYAPHFYFRLFIEGNASFKKHPSFSNEHEYRLLVDGISLLTHYLEFRTTRSTLIPFVPVSIPRRHSQHPDSPDHIIWPLARRWDFIDRVVIGPTANSSLSLDAVSAFLTRRECRSKSFRRQFLTGIGKPFKACFKGLTWSPELPLARPSYGLLPRC